MAETYSCPYCIRHASRVQDLKAHFTRDHDEDIEYDGKYPDKLLSEIPGDDDSPKDNQNTRAIQREKVLSRDGYACQRCGEDQNPDSELEVHHLMPKSVGGSDDIKNLVTLCKSCHKGVHQEMGKMHETHPDLLEELRKVVCG